MTIAAAEPIPLRTDADGVIRIGDSRVPLETVVTTFDAGATPEEIVQDFPVLRLDDVYAVVTWYLRHRGEVEEYLREREEQAAEVRRKVEARFPQHGLRERLLARLQSAKA